MSRVRQTEQQTAGHQIPQGTGVHSNKKVGKNGKDKKQK